MKKIMTSGLMETIENTKMPTKKEAKTSTVEEMIKNYAPFIQKALPKIITPDRFINMMTTAVVKTPKLLECTQMSLISAMLTSAQLGLEPNTLLGQAYLIPRNRSIKTDKIDKSGKAIWDQILEANFQLGYKGMLTLAYRSGEFKTVQAHTVFENDFFEYELGLDPKLKHIPTEGKKGEIRCFYAMYQLINGGNGFVVMSKKDVEERGQKHSQSWDTEKKTWKKGSSWADNFEPMAHKTVLTKLLKFAPVSTDLLRVFEQDNTVKNEIKEDMLTVEPANIFEGAEETINIDSLEEKSSEEEIK